MDIEGDVSEGRRGESGCDEGTGGARDGGGVRGAVGVVRALLGHANGKNWPAHASERRAVRGAEAAESGAGAIAAVGASTLPLATTGGAMEGQ